MNAPPFKDPYTDPSEMADVMLTRTAVGHRSRARVVQYLEECERAHREAKDGKMADFWRKVREEVERRIELEKQGGVPT